MQEIVIKEELTGAEAPVVLSSTPRPDSVPETYWDAVKGEVKMEELLAAVTAEGAAPATKEETPKTAEETQAEALAASAGVNVAEVEATFAETGEIPADVYEKLAGVGIDKALVDEFVQYRTGQADRIREEVFAPYGGEEGTGRMVAWAAENWTAAQAEAFNRAAASGDRGQLELALKGLAADYGKHNGVKPRLLTPQGGNAKARVFGSLQEMMQAQRDPRYKTDPAYRAEVAATLQRSSL